ncbi:phage antirepressor KilAC domain-containing protein [Alloscardovia macacae]|uniref:phage antirepressor KilAC domain-containing protein n=1 Tax=Alloscardovia macacae TaxID=1160091 RepID=UPI00214D1967|nr:phage antirepressor KilAC domain-containing protein [Alloscardovia macacae]
MGRVLWASWRRCLRRLGLLSARISFFALLRDDGYLGKSGSNRNVPLQRYVEQGLFKIKETAVAHSDGHVTLNRTTKVTGKGQTYFVERYAHTRAFDLEEVE